MKTLVAVAITMVMTFYCQILSAQEVKNTSEVEKLKAQKEMVISKEKEALKSEVEEINNRLDTNEITIEDAQKLKEEAARIRALNIENRLAIINNKIALLERNGIENVNTEESSIHIGLGAKKESDILLGVKINTGKERKIKYDRRTASGLIMAFGVNNVITDEKSIEDSDYKIWGSRFFEIGWIWRTRVFKNSNFLRFKYGISYTSNGLKPTGNRSFVVEGNQTNLEEFRLELDKSKFRMDNLVVPIHFEFGPSILKKTEESIRYYTTRKFKIGIGGYLGANLSTRQKLKFKENGQSITDKIKTNYNTNDLIYGVSTYIGVGDTSLYLKYDLSPIFKNAVIDQNRISLGMRFDL